ncbi:MAG: hypothetical protein OEQ29_06215 [Alphaproteobacteria bacterium]|nr:hypothetical protein [Alphaproteobacteria bacterium]
MSTGPEKTKAPGNGPLTRAYIAAFIGISAALVALFLNDASYRIDQRFELILQGISLALAALALLAFGRAGLILVRHYESKK